MEVNDTGKDLQGRSLPTSGGHFLVQNRVCFEAGSRVGIKLTGDPYLRFSPVGLDAKEINRLMSDELLRSLLHDLLVIQGPNHFLGFVGQVFFQKNETSYTLLF